MKVESRITKSRCAKEGFGAFSGEEVTFLPLISLSALSGTLAGFFDVSLLASFCPL